MIKNIASLLLIMFIFSCSKKKDENNFNEEKYIPAKYDTVAIDSFSTGAISRDVAAQIHRSSVAFQDSLLKAKVAAEIVKKNLEDKKKLEDVQKKKIEDEKKKVTEKNDTQKVK